MVPPLIIRKYGIYLNQIVTVTINIEIYSESNFSGECFFEANLEFRHSLNSLKIFQLGTFSIGRKILRATKRIRMEFECWHFFAPGLYRLSLPSTFITSSSEWIQINPPNLAIQIHLPAVSSIFPFCQNALSISWTLPNCPKINELLDFRLRLLAPFNELNEDEHMLYLEEFSLAVPNSEDIFLQKSFIGLHQRKVPTNFLRIPCTKFDIIHEQFCFELVSVSKQSQQHQSWDTKCIRTEAQSANGKRKSIAFSFQ
ncbi:hypothetical protein niasHT_008757 [Heterodera trifolii]|uniref:Arrestin-like N-terminal domain-containing protein n=1 Tax=Heterodera trifolii TaxID=157864 RepID=A0ABD2M288_9BILA